MVHSHDLLFLFRWTIGKYEPSFASFQQQDSQELLVFLLDGLHEDLNRVTEKVIRTFYYIIRFFPDPGSRIPDPKPIFLRA